MEKFPSSREYTGKIYETDFLGEVKLPPEFFTAEKKIIRDWRGWYKNDDDIFELIKKFYPDDPSNPSRELGRELRIEIIDALGLLPDEYDRVKFFTTVGVPQIDKKLGVDAFLEFDDPKQGTKRVTIDITKNPQKVAEGHKADVIVGELPDPKFEDEAYTQAVQELARKIAVKLIQAN